MNSLNMQDLTKHVENNFLYTSIKAPHPYKKGKIVHISAESIANAEKTIDNGPYCLTLNEYKKLLNESLHRIKEFFQKSDNYQKIGGQIFKI